MGITLLLDKVTIAEQHLIEEYIEVYGVLDCRGSPAWMRDRLT